MICIYTQKKVCLTFAIQFKWRWNVRTTDAHPLNRDESPLGIGAYRNMHALYKTTYCIQNALTFQYQLNWSVNILMKHEVAEQFCIKVKFTKCTTKCAYDGLTSAVFFCLGLMEWTLSHLWNLCSCKQMSPTIWYHFKTDYFSSDSKKMVKFTEE